MPPTNLTRNIATSSVWMLLGKVAVTLLSFFLTAALTRSLGVAGYGELTTAFAFLVFFGVIADFGFFQILVREVARRPNEQERITQNIMTIRTIFGLLVYFAAAWLVWLFPYSVAVKVGVMILAVAQFFTSLNNTLVGVFQANLRMDRAVLAEVASRAILLFGVLWALAAGYQSLPIIFIIYVIANFINFLISSIFLRPFVRLSFRYHRPTWRMLIRETWSMGLVTMLIVLYFKIDTIILSVLKTPVDVGIYGVPYKILEILLLVPGILAGNILPTLTQLLAGARDRLTRLIQGSIEVFALFAIGLLVAVFVLAKPAIELVAGSDFITASTISLQLGSVGTLPITAVHVLSILVVAMFFSFFSHLWNIMIVSSGNQKALIKPALTALILNVGLNLILIPRASYLAAAITTVITEGYIFFVAGRLARQFVPTTLSFDRILRIVLAAALMGLIIWPLKSNMILIPIVVGLTSYTIGLLAFKAVPPQALAWLQRKL